VHFGDRVGSGPEIKTPIGFRGILEAPISDMSGVSGFGFSGIGGFRVGFSGRVFGAPDFDIFFKQTILRHFELELGLSPFIRVVVYI